MAAGCRRARLRGPGDGRGAGSAACCRSGRSGGARALALDGLSAWFLLPVGRRRARPPPPPWLAARARRAARCCRCCSPGWGCAWRRRTAPSCCAASASVFLAAGRGTGPPGAPPPLAACGMLLPRRGVWRARRRGDRFRHLCGPLPPRGMARRGAAVPRPRRGGRRWPRRCRWPPRRAGRRGARKAPLLAAALPWPRCTSWRGCCRTSAVRRSPRGGACRCSLAEAWARRRRRCGRWSAEDAEAVPLWAGAAAAGLLDGGARRRAAVPRRRPGRAGGAGGRRGVAAGAWQRLGGGDLGPGRPAVAWSAGSARLDRLGGLARFMPFPPRRRCSPRPAWLSCRCSRASPGCWALLQALVADWRLGGAALPLCCAAALVLAGAASAIGAAAMPARLRRGVPGRPRTPRGAGAREAAGVLRWAVLVPVAPCCRSAWFRDGRWRSARRRSPLVAGRRATAHARRRPGVDGGRRRRLRAAAARGVARRPGAAAWPRR